MQFNSTTNYIIQNDQTDEITPLWYSFDKKLT